MSSLFGSGAELRQRSADQALEARVLHQLVKDTRLMVEETRRLLDSPLWVRMAGVPAEPDSPTSLSW
jgi:hypothetical protein